MNGRDPTLARIVRKDGRYAYEAYVFLYEALTHTQKLFGRKQLGPGKEPKEEHHVTGAELSEGVCDLARNEFGLMAGVVFRIWGVRQTDDIGRMVFNMIEGDLLSKTDRDSLDDFRGLFDLEDRLTGNYRIDAGGPLGETGDEF